MYSSFFLSGIIFIIIAIISHYIDVFISTTGYSDVFVVDNAFVQSIIIMSIGVIVTILTITFSSILVVLTLYSAQFSPRTLGDFLQRKVPVKVLAYLSGSIIFLLINAILIEQGQVENYPVSFLLIMLVVLIGIGIFVYYIQYVSKAIQISSYMEQLVQEAVTQIKTYSEALESDPMISSSKEGVGSFENAVEQKSFQTGYFTGINIVPLMEFLTEKDIRIIITVSLNDYVYEDDIIFEYTTKKSKYEFTDEDLKKFLNFSDAADNEHELFNKSKKLIDIGIRALSPGTNDPKTAIDCINHLSFILMKLANNFSAMNYQDENGIIRVNLQNKPFDVILYEHFYQLHMYGHKDLFVYSSIIQALSRIAKSSSALIKRSTWKFYDYLAKDFDLNSLHRYDYKLINDEIKELAYCCDKMSAYKESMQKSAK